ncbi:hypothetical protein GOP47_0005436 [Adiantum capillus-veneris]|uniref:Amino acid transporter transmembrane domain-containing protein n=1 Tax=Adiantum capillus-veneris TaxID=13818 RepID=A0A9D4ZN84_ADICA|nr:hypothetical protein GOP47_0005436 [Adiantum capillus-veneris]
MGPHVVSDEESSFKFTRLQDSEYLVEQQIDIPLASSLTRQYWPQSYERSMDLYSRSPSSETGKSFLQHSKQHYIGKSSDLSVDKCEGRLSEALPLLNSAHTIEDKVCEEGSPADDVRPAFQQQQKSSFFQAVFNGVNMLAGVGILSMPYAVAQGGWAGLSCLLIFAAVCCYTGVLLRRCLDLHPHLSGYPDIGQAAFGRVGRIVVSGLLYGELFAVAIEFLILEGDNLTQLISFEGLNFGFFRLSSEKSFVIISAAVMLPTVWLRDLGLLSYLSLGGVLACITVLLAVAWTGIFEVGFTNHGQLLNLQGFPIAVGLYAFCYCGHAVFPNIYGSMREKGKFSLVLVVSFMVCTIIYGGIAVLGFLMFGDDIKSQVTLNLPRGRVATTIAIIATLVNPFAKYSLTVTPLAAAFEELLPVDLKAWNFTVWGMIIRTLLVVSTVIVALTVPFFAYLMALVGSFLSTTVAITIPCLCYMKLFSGRIPLWERVLIITFVTIGLGACIAVSVWKREMLASVAMR